MSQIITDHDALARWADEMRRRGKVIVWGNGAFDLLHVGHVRYLLAAAREGDRLVIGVNSDASVRALKGPDRPIQPLAERMEILAAIRGVDVVTCFDTRTCDALIERIRPHVFADGRDHTPEDVVERETVKRIGARLVLVGDPKERSTSGLVAAVRGE